MREQVEGRLRALVADSLGVREDELERDVSLRDDLAVDSLDMVELAVAIEEAWGVTIPDRLLATVRTYGELAAATIDLVRRRRRLAPAAARLLDAVPVRARITGRDGRGAALDRTEMLTPYVIQALGEDTLRAGPGAQLHLTLPATCDDGALHRVRERFSWLGERAIEVRVARAAHAPRGALGGLLDAAQA